MFNKGGAGLLLDTYPAEAAYSLRYLSSAFVGNDVILVRRSSDNAELGFTPTEITDGTLTSWVGVGNDGNVVDWYDQSGNGLNLTPTTTPPLIVSSGVLNDDGTPYLQNDGNENTILRNISFSTLSTNSTLFTVYERLENSSGIILNGQIGNFIGIMTSGSALSPNQAAGTPLYYKNGVLIPSATRGDLYFEFALNENVLVSITDINLSSWTALNPYAFPPTNALTNESKFREFVLYDSDQSANQTPIESNINAYYSIY